VNVDNETSESSNITKGDAQRFVYNNPRAVVGAGRTVNTDMQWQVPEVIMPKHFQKGYANLELLVQPDDRKNNKKGANKQHRRQSLGLP
jgi:hypothetical protein